MAETPILPPSSYKHYGNRQKLGFPAQLDTLCTPLAGVTKWVFYAFMSNVILEDMENSTKTTPQIDIKEMTNNMVHPEIKETITQLKNQDPLLTFTK